MKVYYIILTLIILINKIYAVQCFPQWEQKLNLQADPETQEDPGVTRLREYLRINSAHPDPDYESCITWLRNQSEEIGLDFNLLNFEPPDLFAVWLTWPGSNPDLKSILINSHMDVVAVDPSKWDHNPFEAFKDLDGNIFGRGTTDMKSSTVGALEAIRVLNNKGFIPLRTIHLSILPDEELELRGMKPFVNSVNFTNLNIGLDIDEGFVNPGDEILVTYAEKSIWQFNFTVKGTSAHASTLPEETAGQKLQIVINRLMEFRETQVQLIEEGFNSIENVTSLNLVKMGGGLGNNIIPDELWASFDMRVFLKPGWNFTDVENMLNEIKEEAGPNVTLTFLEKSLESGETLVDNSNIWWTELQNTCDELNVKCTPQVFSATTDARFVRNLGIPTFGLNPFLKTVNTAHQDNENINEIHFLEGVNRYVAFFQNFASVASEM